MTIRQRLEQRQKPVFAQSLTQSVKILELPLMELRTAVEAELTENPVVEELSRETSPASPEHEASPPEDDGPLPFEQEVAPSELANYEKPIPGKKESLADFLLRQLRINAREEEELRIGTHLINNIDENGYLGQGIEPLCQEADCGQERLLSILALIQTFDPAGVGSRDLRECLLIQLKKNGETDPLLINLVTDHLEELAAGNLKKLCKKLKCDHGQLLACLQKIHRLEPKPGRSFSTDEVGYVTPDVSVEEKDEALTVITKDDSIPTLRINPVYRNMLKSKKVGDETKEFIRQRLTQAGNLIRAIENRRKTLLKVVAVIAEFQREAMTEGLDKLRPLTFKEVADQVQMHESTISRVVMHKYIQTPAGLFRLKDFFSGSLKTSGGDSVSAQSVKEKIRELVEAEDGNKPLRDQEIADLLREAEKTPIARRTVAKYREMLKIPPASRRRRIS